MEQNDKLHVLSLHHNGEKCQGILKETDSLCFAEIRGNSIHVIGSGYIANDECFDYYQAWIPRSIVNVVFDIYGYKNMLRYPEWAKVKFYHMSRCNFDAFMERRKNARRL